MTSHIPSELIFQDPKAKVLCADWEKLPSKPLPPSVSTTFFSWPRFPCCGCTSRCGGNHTLWRLGEDEPVGLGIDNVEMTLAVHYDPQRIRPGGIGQLGIPPELSAQEKLVAMQDLLSQLLSGASLSRALLAGGPELRRYLGNHQKHRERLQPVDPTPALLQEYLDSLKVIGPLTCCLCQLEGLEPGDLAAHICGQYHLQQREALRQAEQTGDTSSRSWEARRFQEWPTLSGGLLQFDHLTGLVPNHATRTPIIDT